MFLKIDWLAFLSQTGLKLFDIHKHSLGGRSQSYVKEAPFKKRMLPMHNHRLYHRHFFNIDLKKKKNLQIFLKNELCQKNGNESIVSNARRESFGHKKEPL